MQEFDFQRPATITELKECLSQPGARVLAGGTDIVPRMRRGRFSAPILVDTSGIAAMRFMEDRGSEVILGSLTTHEELAESPLIRNINPALATAAESIGCRQTRCRGTLGGNIANASPAGDTLPPLLVYDSSLLIQSLDGERRISLEDFLLGPGEVDLQSGEFIHSISFLPLKGKWGSCFVKVGKRSGMAVAVVNAAAAVVLEGSGKVADIRLSLGAVAPIPIRCRKMEDALRGQQPEPAMIREISELCQEEISPITDIRGTDQYRLQAAVVTLNRALEGALIQAEERGE